MEDGTILAICVVAALTIAAGIWNFFSGKHSPFAHQWRQQANELEVEIRMGSGAELIEKLCALAALYRRLGRHWDAEQGLNRAALICKQTSGERSAAMIPVLDEFSKLMDSMHRKQEAANYRKLISQINESYGREGGGPSR